MSVMGQIKGGLVSVIVACTGPLERTRLCVSSLLRHTRRPWELIAVAPPGGELSSYLLGLADAVSAHIEVVGPPAEPGGLPHASGIALACGDYLALIDDHTIVTDGWLEQLTGLLESVPKIGMVGPMLSDAAPPQRAELAETTTVGESAARWRAEHRGQWFTTAQLAGSCLLIRRELYESVLGQSARSPSDLAARVRATGLELAVARDLFLYHDAGTPDAGRAATSAANFPRFAPKGLGADFARLTAPRRSIRRGPQSDAGGTRPLVSLTMIVRNEERNIGPCLESAAGLCQELIVVDTGSTDGTARVARALGATVVPFTWVDDFAAARNAALDSATGRYAFWLDADDRIDPENRQRLQALFARLAEADQAAYVMKQLSSGSDGAEAITSADHVRLFPIRDDVGWSYRVHEQILPALRAAGIPVRWTEIGIGHVGYAEASLRDGKLDRNLRILLAELRERPADPFVLFNIGWVAIDRREPKTALGYLRASLAASAPGDSIVRKLYVLIARACQMLGDTEAALDACAAGRALEPGNAELWFREALVRRQVGDSAGAEACWRRILELGRPQKFSSFATGIYGHLTRRNLASLAEERGDLSEAARLWQEVLAECPGDAAASAALARLATSRS